MLDQKILVTGATGFIGSYLVRYLVRQGYKNIIALKRKDSSLALVEEVKNAVTWLDADILDLPALEDAMEAVSLVYHTAAIVSFHEKGNRDMMKINVEGTANVVNLCLEKGVEKLLHVSSIAALGRKPNDPHIDEQTPWKQSRWNSPYGVSKYLAEMEVWRGIAEGLNAVIVNPSNVLGSGFWKGRTTTGQMFYKVWQGLPFYPQGTSGFVDVRDTVRFMVKLMESDIYRERFILNGENLPFKVLFEEMAKVLGVRPPFIRVNPLIRETAWRLAWVASKISGKPAFITRQTARSSARTFFYDNSKSLGAFPFSYTPIRETIEQTGRQFLENVGNDFKPAVLDF